MLFAFRKICYGAETRVYGSSKDRIMNQMFGDYQLREAAGCYWLIDMRQSGRTWKQPLRLNETGAFLLQGVYEGNTREELAAALAAHYEMAAEELQEDVDAFLAQLDMHQITFV